MRGSAAPASTSATSPRRTSRPPRRDHHDLREVLGRVEAPVQPDRPSLERRRSRVPPARPGSAPAPRSRSDRYRHRPRQARRGARSHVSCALSPPTMVTCATPAIARSSAADRAVGQLRERGRAERRRSERQRDDGAAAFGSKRLRTGSRMSGGSWGRTADMASRTSCMAWSMSLENTNDTTICPKPSVDVEFSLSSAADARQLVLDAGRRPRARPRRARRPDRRRRRRRPAARCPGNSSVSSRSSDASPKTTSAIIETIVMIGRLMAKSEMNTAVG